MRGVPLSMMGVEHGTDTRCNSKTDNSDLGKKANQISHHCDGR